MPEPRITPQRQGSSLEKSMPESRDGVDAGDVGELHEAVEPLDVLGRRCSRRPTNCGFRRRSGRGNP